MFSTGPSWLDRKVGRRDTSSPDTRSSVGEWITLVLVFAVIIGAAAVGMK